MADCRSLLAGDVYADRLHAGSYIKPNQAEASFEESTQRD